MVQGKAPGVQRAPRFEVRAEIGSGAVGVVYRAFDRERRMEVALKSLRLPTGAHLYRFKREFRLLADIVHPNLVTLYELQSQDEQWFISMELVEGVHFIDHVRPPLPGAVEVAGDPEPSEEATQPSIATAVRPTRRRGPVDLARLRPALRQLAGALAHLHAAGRLHRDIKPSNVLVEPSGRLVICDFGLVVEAGAEPGTRRFVGTPSYASPEQAAGAELTPASDWYSVGVMLHEALTGRLPFAGPTNRVLAHKQSHEPPLLGPVPPGAEDLARLSRALLARDPAERADGAAIVQALESGAGGSSRGPAAVAAPGFVGRAQQLAVLHEAARAVDRQQRCVAVFVHGEPGAGKTELVQRFLSELHGDGLEPLVLGGKCHEREQLPYKALDPIIDALSSYLASRPPESIDPLPTDDAACLARLFPVLERIPAIATAAASARELGQVSDPRRRALTTLRKLLAGLAARHRLILFIDDLQWGDVDSAPVLRELIYAPEGPALLLIGTYRTGDAAVSPMLQRLMAPDSGGYRGDLRDLPLPGLHPGEARELAGTLLGAGDDLDTMVTEAGGNPLFLLELARGVRTGQQASPSLELMLEQRVRRLPDEARRFLTVVAAAARPLQATLAGQAAAVANEAAVLATLSAERMIRASQPGERIEVYHDQIGHAALRIAGPEAIQGIHRRLATLIETLGAADPASLADHWMGAGEAPRAGSYAREAARRAEAAFAYHRAAHYYALVLEVDAPDGEDRRLLQRRLADALVNCGRLPEAAGAYLAAAEGAAEDDAYELRRLALEQYLRAGLSARGREIARPLGHALGVSIPRGRGRTLLAIATGRARTALRGIGFDERPEAEIDRATLERVDVCWSLTTGFGFDDPIAGVAVQTQHLRHALDAGEIYRVVRALATEICYRALTGDLARAETLSPIVLELAERTRNTGALGHATAAVGLAAFISGHWRRAEDLLGRGCALLLRRPSSVRWETDLTTIVRMAALVNLGDMKRLCRSLPALVREAEEQGNVHAANGLRAWRGNIAWLAMGDPDEARRQWRLGSQREQTSERHPHEFYDLVTNVRIELYCGDAPAAWSWIERGWASRELMAIRRFPNPTIELHFLRARAALAMAAAGRDTDHMLVIATRCARKLARTPLAWGPACAALVRACVQLQRGDLDRADAELVRAAIAFDRCDMALLARVARRTRGALIGGSEGAELVAAAEAWMREQTIVEPAAMSRIFVPVPVPAATV